MADENDDLVEAGSDDVFDTSRDTSDADLAASALGLEENDDIDENEDDDTEPDLDEDEIFDDEDVVSEGGALDHDGTHNVSAGGATGGGGTMDDDETLGSNQRQPDEMALDRATITDADLKRSEGGSGKIMFDSANRPSDAGDERLPGEDKLDSFREHDAVVESYIGGDVGTAQSATPDDEAPAPDDSAG